MRHTYRVSDLKANVNRMLQCDITEDERKALCVLLESVLFEIEQYKGFSFKGENDCPAPREEGYYNRFYF